MGPMAALHWLAVLAIIGIPLGIGIVVNRIHRRANNEALPLSLDIVAPPPSEGPGPRPSNGTV